MGFRLALIGLLAAALALTGVYYLYVGVVQLLEAPRSGPVWVHAAASRAEGVGAVVQAYYRPLGEGLVAVKLVVVNEGPIRVYYASPPYCTLEAGGVVQTLKAPPVVPVEVGDGRSSLACAPGVVYGALEPGESAEVRLVVPWSGGLRAMATVCLTAGGGCESVVVEVGAAGYGER